MERDVQRDTQPYVQPDVQPDYKGHEFAFVLRVDVEHREAERYTGDPRTERVATRLLLDVLEEAEARVTCAILGITAEFYPDIVRWCAERHELIAHSMFHEPPYPEMSYRQQHWDIKRTMLSIQEAAGVRVRGLACPHHGMANEDTARAASDLGLDYLLGRVGAVTATSPFVWYHPPDRERGLLVSGRTGLGGSDWSARRREWPWIEEPWSPQAALARWKGQIDRARQARAVATLAVHPWMLQINEGEVRVIQEVLRYAKDEGGWLTSYDAIVDQYVAPGTRGTPAAAGA
ncbi:MAG TPA: polysaccharide deacetylase family protein [Chloroflexota bacterium]|nr:polysaccharide deacetylase family protein [Chloroflexota bacterium]